MSTIQLVLVLVLALALLASVGLNIGLLRALRTVDDRTAAVGLTLLSEEISELRHFVYQETLRVQNLERAE